EPEELSGLSTRLTEALDDDLNMPVALAHVAEFLRGVNELADRASAKKGSVTRSAVAAGRDGFALLDRWLGLGGDDPAAVLDRIRERRTKARGLFPELIEKKI